MNLVLKNVSRNQLPQPTDSKNETIDNTTAKVIEMEQQNSKNFDGAKGQLLEKQINRPTDEGLARPNRLCALTID